MGNLKTRIEQTKYKLKHNFFTLDNIVVITAIVLCAIWTWGSITSMTRNWELAEKVAEERRALALIDLEVETLELENEYYKSDEYRELAVRKLQNKKLPGETMIYLPKNSETAKNKHKSEETKITVKTEELSNFDQWMQFLFGA